MGQFKESIKSLEELYDECLKRIDKLQEENKKLKKENEEYEQEACDYRRTIDHYADEIAKQDRKIKELEENL